MYTPARMIGLHEEGVKFGPLAAQTIIMTITGLDPVRDRPTACITGKVVGKPRCVEFDLAGGR